MAASSPRNKNDKPVEKTICKNRRAYHEYEIQETLECGIVLVGTEVKSLRAGHATLDQAYAVVKEDELFLVGCEIPEYEMGNRLNHKPKRSRKLLLRRREIEKFATKASQQGFTLIPVRLYFKDGLVKCEVAVARGKQKHDKRQALKQADAQREMARVKLRKR